MSERTIDTIAHGALCGTCIAAGVLQLGTGVAFLGAFWLAIAAFAIAVRFSR